MSAVPRLIELLSDYRVVGHSSDDYVGAHASSALAAITGIVIYDVLILLFIYLFMYVFVYVFVYLSIYLLVCLYRYFFNDIYHLLVLFAVRMEPVIIILFHGTHTYTNVQLTFLSLLSL